jgi:hypothetical protein
MGEGFMYVCVVRKAHPMSRREIGVRLYALGFWKYERVLGREDEGFWMTRLQV